jgi:Na+-driven multidrug efflux pump
MMRAYAVTLLVHSYLRWIVLALVVIVFGKALVSRVRSAGDDKLHRALIGVVDLQFLLGLALYVFLSPITSAFFSAPGAAMKEPTLRFWGIEHIIGMVLAVALLHIGRARKPPTRRRVLITVGLALVCMLGSVPWPSLPWGRPLFREVVTRTESVAPATYPFGQRVAS